MPLYNWRQRAHHSRPSVAQATVRTNQRLQHDKHEIAWQVSNGDTPRAIKQAASKLGLTLPPTGSPSQAGLLVTKTLLFGGEGAGEQAVFHAYARATEKTIGQTALPGPQSLADDLSYERRQYAVVGIPGAMGLAAQLVVRSRKRGARP